MSRFLNASLKNLLFSAFGALLIILVIQGLLSLRTVAHLDRISTQTEIWLPRIDALNKLNVDFNQLLLLQAHHLLAQSESDKGKIDTHLIQATANLNADRQTYEALVPNASERENFDRAMAHMDKFQKLHEKIIALSRKGLAVEANSTLDRELKPVSGAIFNELKEALLTIKEEAQAAHTNAKSEYNFSLIITALLLVAGFGAAFGIAQFAHHQIVAFLNGVTNAISDLAQNNYTPNVPHTERTDEIGALARSVTHLGVSLANAENARHEQNQAETNRHAEQLEAERARYERERGEKLLSTKRESSLKSLRVAADMINGINDITVDLTWLGVSTCEMTKNAQMIAAASVEMATSVEQIATNSEGAAQDASSADQTVSIGRIAIDKVSKAIANITEVFEETALSVDGLSHASEQIGQILGVIEGIASQTNLLALNASIEAARAGEAGKGFAIVAQEVKALANQTTKATDDIAQRITSLREGMSAILRTMNLSKTAVVEGQGAIGEAASNMEQIANQVANVSFKMQEISGILAQQNAAACEISSNIDHVANTAKANEGRLANMATKLHESNKMFSTTASEWYDENDPRSTCEIAKIDHIMFKKRVIDAVSGRVSWSATEVPNHHNCRLGKWYDGIVDSQLRMLSAYSALIDPHRQVHEAAKAALSAHADHDKEATMHALNEMNSASQEVFRLLTELSATISVDVGAILKKAA